VGNKCDLIEQKVVDNEQGEALAAEYGIKFMEASAKSNIGVDDAFINLAKGNKLFCCFLINFLIVCPQILRLV
jgi:Ras-related protein Rab-8A